MRLFLTILIWSLFVASCVPEETSPYEKEAKRLCSTEQMILSEKCAREHGPITIADERENSIKFMEYKKCSSKLRDLYISCIKETILAIKAGEQPPVSNRLNKEKSNR